MELTKPNLLARALNKAAQEIDSQPVGRVFGRISKSRGRELHLYRDQLEADEIESTIRKAKKMGYTKVTIGKHETETGFGPCGKLCHCQKNCQFL